MKSRLKDLLNQGAQYIADCPEDHFSYKPSVDKWSKKEILGHLIDSGINNLQRFTEIRFEKKPFVIKNYNQNELVKANDYENADSRELLNLWLAINNRIMNVMSLQTPETLAFKIQFENGEAADLKFLMEDYVDHLAHHLNQIMNK